jgi:hypothetical protein
MVGAPGSSAPAPPRGQAGRRKVGPTCGFATSPEVGPGTNVGTLKTRYPLPRVQAPTQDKRQGSSGAAECPCGSGARLPTHGSSRGAACPHGSGSRLLARGSSEAATCLRGSRSRLLTQGSSGAATCHLCSSTCLLTQGSSRAITCPMDELYKLQAIK